MNKTDIMCRYTAAARFTSLFIICFLPFLFSGCRKPVPDGFAADDIPTLDPELRGRTVITVRTEYNVNIADFEHAVEQKFPAVDVIIRHHCSRETQYELYRSLESGTAEDIILSPNIPSLRQSAPSFFLDLSGESFIDNYSGPLIAPCVLDGSIYYLPGPSDTYGIIYDKTLFAAHGWQVPASYTDFITLCRTINATGLRAFQPTCLYARQAQIIFTMFCYSSVFGGIHNLAWLDSYQKGTAGMAPHLMPAFARYTELQDAGIITAGDFTVEPGNRSRMMYTDHSCAMIVENQMADVYARAAQSDHEYGMFPFWCGDRPEDAHLIAVSNYYVAINKNLAANKKKRNMVRSIVSWISSEEGQRAIAGGDFFMQPPLKNTSVRTNSFNAGTSETIRNGGLIPEVALMADGNNNAAEKALKKNLPLFLRHTLSAEAVMAACDAARDTALSAGFSRGTAIGTATTDFTNMQTALFIADAFQKKTGADIGLCLAGTVYCGTESRIYKGTITDKDIATLDLSIGLRRDDPNDKKLWEIALTGRQLRELLALPYTCKNHAADSRQPYYAAAGLKIVFAPRAPVQKKLVSVTLANGDPVQDDATYTVALWGWPDFDSTCPYRIIHVWNESAPDIITEALKNAGGTIAPFSDRRFTVRW